VPGGFGHTLSRYRDILNYKNVDIVFIGSSHANQGFDVRLFESGGYRVFNMGTTSQTPMNSFYLLTQYLDTLKPKLIVMEVFPRMVSEDGLESCFDVINNLPLSYEILEMAVATKNIQALHSLAIKVADEYSYRNRYQQRSYPDFTYVPGGYSDEMSTFPPNGLPKPPKQHIQINHDQTGYLKRIIKLAKSRNIGLLFVVQPIAAELVESFDNFEEVKGVIAGIAAEYSVSVLDYSKPPFLDTRAYFVDYDHLNRKGVTETNLRLLHHIQSEHLIKR
jgi:hypothetical protein